MSHFTIAVVGNPNCGKTTLFNALTGFKQRVGNWPGVTVERKSGSFRHHGAIFEVVDTPGIYSLAATSVDEVVTRDYVLSGEADLIVNIVDASHIERNLYLTTHLLEMNAPVVIALNMMDLAKECQIEIDINALSRKLGCPVVPLVVNKKQGLQQLKEIISQGAAERKASTVDISYPDQIQKVLVKLLPLVENVAESRGYDARWLSLKLLEGDDLVGNLVSQEAQVKRQQFQKAVEAELGDDIDILIASSRYDFIHSITRDTVKKKGQVSDSLSEKLDRIVLHRIFGIPIFLLTMYLMFMFTINFGGAFIDLKFRVTAPPKPFCLGSKIVL